MKSSAKSDKISLSLHGAGADLEEKKSIREQTEANRDTPNDLHRLIIYVLHSFYPNGPYILCIVFCLIINLKNEGTLAIQVEKELCNVLLRVKYKFVKCLWLYIFKFFQRVGTDPLVNRLNSILLIKFATTFRHHRK